MRVKLKSGTGGLLLFLGFAIVAVLVGRHPAVRQYLSEESIKAWVERLGVWGPLALLGLSLALPFLFLPRWPVGFVAGTLYGIVAGTLIGTAMGTLGAMVHFALSRRLFKTIGERMRKRFQLPDRMENRKAVPLIFGLRAFPLSNNGLTNLLAGAINMRLLPFMAATFLGMVPSTLMYAAWGKLMRKPSPGHTALAVGLVVILVLGAWWLGRQWMPVRSERSDADDDDLVGG